MVVVTRRDASTQRQIQFVSIFIAKWTNVSTRKIKSKFEKEKNTWKIEKNTRW